MTLGAISVSRESGESVYTVDFWFDDQTAGACEFTISSDRQVRAGSCDCYGGRPTLAEDLQRTWTQYPESRRRLEAALRAFDVVARPSICDDQSVD